MFNQLYAQLVNAVDTHNQPAIRRIGHDLHSAGGLNWMMKAYERLPRDKQKLVDMNWQDVGAGVLDMWV
jgi:hypothetical protein